MSPDSLDHVKGLCRTWVERDVHKALCVLVARRGVVCLHEAFGTLGPHGGPPLERDSIFPTMSISKIVTATVLMSLVEDGLVGLTRPVHAYVPEFSGDSKELVLVHHLLTHTSGIANDDIINAHVQARSERAGLPPPGATRFPEIHNFTVLGSEVPLAATPGEEMAYANLNYELLGQIIGRATGRSLADVATSRVFSPLGMSDSSYVLPEDHDARTIGWHLMPPDYMDTTSPEFKHAPWACGGVHSTALDVAVLGQTFLNGGSYSDARILGRGSITEMTRDQVPGIGRKIEIGEHKEQHAEASWGYGWGIAGNEKWANYPTFTRGTFNHSGAGAMMLWIDPVREIVGVYLSVCRINPVTASAITNVDLFVNAVTAPVED